MGMNNFHHKNLPIDADTYSNYSGLTVSGKDEIKNIIHVSNNRAAYFARFSKKYADKSQEASEKSEYFYEQNTNITQEDILKVRKALELQISTKQDRGDYAERDELPTKLSDLTNDTNYVSSAQMNTAINQLLPTQSGNKGKILCTDGENLSWEKIRSGELFDIKVFDHILNNEESKGYALQGTYVYKESTPERYGYPNFYAKCVEEYNNSVLYSPQRIKYTIENGQIVFQKGSIFKTPNGFEADGTTPKYEYTTLQENKAYTLSSAVTSFPYTGYIACSTTGSLYIWSTATTNTSATSGFVFHESQNIVTSGPSGSQCSFPLLKATFTNSTTVTVNTVYQGNDFLEVAPTSEPYLQTKRNPNGHLFYDIADKASVDTFFNANGVAWFYGIDEENERVFLPRNNRFMQYTVDTNKVNDFNEAGLPNITGTLGIRAGSKTGCFAVEPQSVTGSYGAGDSTQANYFTNFNASRSSEIYGNSETVQPASSNKLLYIIVGNTEAEQALTEITEITTSENDTVPLFTGMYFDFMPNNPSWLKAGTQQNSGGIYTSCYSILVNCLTEANNIYGLKVIETSAMVAGTDYSEYWKVNQDETYFITPTKLSYGMLNPLSKTIPVKGNGLVLGLSNGSANYGLVNDPHDNHYVSVYSPLYGESYTSTFSAYGANNFTALGVTTDSSKSGLVADLSSAESDTAQLYFKVANAVQNLELLDAGEVLEAISGKTDMAQASAAGMPSNRYIDLTLGANGTSYIAPANGWIYLSKVNTSGANDMSIVVNDTNDSITAKIAIKGSNTVSGNASIIFIPVLKNDKFWVNYTYTGQTQAFRFTYAEGSN